LITEAKLKLVGDAASTGVALATVNVTFTVAVAPPFVAVNVTTAV